MSPSPFVCSSRDGQGQTDSSSLGFASQAILGTNEGKRKMSYITPSHKMGWFSFRCRVSLATG